VSTVGWIQSVWTVLVVVFFIAVVIRTYFVDRKSDHDDYASIPLIDDDDVTTSVRHQ
jgi:cbb3-type cytochrome oxidase subunit 3